MEEILLTILINTNWKFYEIILGISIIGALSTFYSSKHVMKCTLRVENWIMIPVNINAKKPICFGRTYKMHHTSLIKEDTISL
jgi:hypothetical protein